MLLIRKFLCPRKVTLITLPLISCVNLNKFFYFSRYVSSYMQRANSLCETIHQLLHTALACEEQILSLAAHFYLFSFQKGFLKTIWKKAKAKVKEEKGKSDLHLMVKELFQGYFVNDMVLRQLWGVREWIGEQEFE